MTLTELKAALTQSQPPKGLSPELTSMWYDGRGDWERSHQIAQDIPGTMGSLIHAYLHRKEGDQWNAGYWYDRAGRQMPQTSLEEEWEDIVIELLEQEG